MGLALSIRAGVQYGSDDAAPTSRLVMPTGPAAMLALSGTNAAIEQTAAISVAPILGMFRPIHSGPIRYGPL
jgi:hypothetical protein